MSTRTDAGGEPRRPAVRPGPGGRHAPARLAPRYGARRRRLRRPAGRRRGDRLRGGAPGARHHAPVRRRRLRLRRRGGPALRHRLPRLGAPSRARSTPSSSTLADAEGIHLRDALTAFGGDPVAAQSAARRGARLPARSTSSRARRWRRGPAARGRDRDRRGRRARRRFYGRGRARRARCRWRPGATRAPRTRGVRPRRRGGRRAPSRAWSPPSAASPLRRASPNATRGRRRRRSTSAISDDAVRARGDHHAARAGDGDRRRPRRRGAVGALAWTRPRWPWTRGWWPLLARGGPRRAAPAQRRWPRRGRALQRRCRWGCSSSAARAG